MGEGVAAVQAMYLPSALFNLFLTHMCIYSCSSEWWMIKMNRILASRLERSSEVETVNEYLAKVEKILQIFSEILAGVQFSEDCAKSFCKVFDEFHLLISCRK